MDYINNQGEKIGSLTTAISNDKNVTINRINDVTIVTTRDATQERSRQRRSSAIRHMGSRRVWIHRGFAILPERLKAELKPLEDRTALVGVWWLSPGPFRAADRFSLGNSATPPFGFPRSDTNRDHGEFLVRTQFP